MGLPLREGRYTWSSGHYVEVFDSTVVEVETDAGLTGWGEDQTYAPQPILEALDQHTTA